MYDCLNVLCSKLLTILTTRRKGQRGVEVGEEGRREGGEGWSSEFETNILHASPPNRNDHHREYSTSTCV